MSDLPTEENPIKESKAPAADPEKPKRRPISRKDDEYDVRYKFWHLTAQYSSLVVAIFGFVVVWASLERNTQSVRANVQNIMLTHVADLNKIFMKRPELYPYFYQGVQPPDPKLSCIQGGSAKNAKATTPCYTEVLLAATSVADLLDIVDTQSVRFRDQWEDPEAWDRWVEDSIRQSPILREYLRRNCRWYGKRLIRDLKNNEPAPEKLSEDCEQYLQPH